jgi:hypothetical protein
LAALDKSFESACASRAASPSTARRVRGSRTSSLWARASKSCAGDLHRPGDHLADRDRPPAQRNAAAGDARDVEKIVHQPDQVLHLALDDGPLALAGLRLAQAHQVQRSEDGRQRSGNV